ncbi:MAG: Wzz/FepE/Etk N-terminal domain-containing protein [Candidatus Sulfotelmatobacter sp.]
MIANRELTIDDYLAMLRRRAKVILIPALLAPLAAWMGSYAFPPKYTSQALILVEGQKVPETMVLPAVSEDLTERVATLQQQVLSRSALQPVVERLQLSKGGQKNMDEVIDNIRANLSVEPVPDLTEIGPTAVKKKPGQGSPVPGFYLKYTASTPREAQAVCNELTSLMITDNGKFIDAAAAGTSDVLSKALDDAKSHLDDLDAKVAAFKKQYVGQLPGDQDNNLKILMGLNSQLEANTQTLNREQQDKAYTESLLGEQVAAWKEAQDATNPQTLQKQLNDLEAQLPELQARYTADHPDVIKAKADIAELKKKLDELKKAATQSPASTSEQASANEPVEIQKLRLQVHQYGDAIAAASRDEKRLQQEIAVYQNRVTLTPSVEEEYKLLARDYENAQKNYQELLTDKSKTDLTEKMDLQQQGERMFPLNPASLPEDPSSPIRWQFAAGGLGAGLALGLGIALWLELRDNSIRTEADAEAALELPLLVALPWVGKAENGANGKAGFWNRHKQESDQHKESVGA